MHVDLETLGCLQHHAGKLRKQRCGLVIWFGQVYQGISTPEEGGKNSHPGGCRGKEGGCWGREGGREGGCWTLAACLLVSGSLIEKKKRGNWESCSPVRLNW